MADSLKVVSIFYSIQGEGRFVGEASIFIRLWGCNLVCNFCDDELHRGSFETLEYEEILARIGEFEASQVVITGGEPTLYDLNPFIKTLHLKGYFVAVETNGFNLKNIELADWITYSPKDWNSILESGFSEVKFIVDRASDIREIVEFKSSKDIYIQPQNGKSSIDRDNLNFCIELVLRYPHLKLSVQLHKFLNLE